MGVTAAMSMSTEACLQGSLGKQRIYSLILCHLLTMLFWLWSTELIVFRYMSHRSLVDTDWLQRKVIFGFKHARAVYINLSNLQRKPLTIYVGYKMPYILVETRRRFDRMNCLRFEGRTGYLV